MKLRNIKCGGHMNNYVVFVCEYNDGTEAIEIYEKASSVVNYIVELQENKVKLKKIKK